VLTYGKFEVIATDTIELTALSSYQKFRANCSNSRLMRVLLAVLLPQVHLCLIDFERD